MAPIAAELFKQLAGVAETKTTGSLFNKLMSPGLVNHLDLCTHSNK